MADVWDKRKRSEVMSLIRSHGNKGTELRLIEIFRIHGIKGWRRKQKLPGKPDFVFAKERLCIFVDGCFWHGCAKCYRPPSSNEVYWDAKVLRNRERDQKVGKQLRKMGWLVLRLWEHELSAKDERRIKSRILRRLERNKVSRDSEDPI